MSGEVKRPYKFRYRQIFLFLEKLNALAENARWPEEILRTPYVATKTDHGYHGTNVISKIVQKKLCVCYAGCNRDGIFSLTFFDILL